MYIGRIVAVGLTQDGQLYVGYRVSSRSFPNRTAVVGANKVSIVPKAGHEADIHKNPYIAYNCLRIVCDGEVAVMTNGSHTDPIAEKIDQGMPVRDALTLISLSMDYEKDQYNTPRISAVVDKVDQSAWLATVRDDGLEVQRAPLKPGTFFYVATYEENQMDPAYSGSCNPENTDALCTFLLSGGLFAERTNPVSAVAALAQDTGFEMATMDFNQ